jgi:hypothetical protein
MAMAIMLAFTFKAKINFMGWKFIQGWKEFQAVCREGEASLHRAEDEP